MITRPQAVLLFIIFASFVVFSGLVAARNGDAGGCLVGSTDTHYADSTLVGFTFWGCIAIVGTVLLSVLWVAHERQRQDVRDEGMGAAIVLFGCWFAALSCFVAAVVTSGIARGQLRRRVVLPACEDSWAALKTYADGSLFSGIAFFGIIYTWILGCLLVGYIRRHSHTPKADPRLGNTHPQDTIVVVNEPFFYY